MTMITPLTERQLDDIAAKIGTYRKHEPTGFACCTAHLVADAGATLLAEVRRLRFRLAELGEQGPEDRETVSEAAQMYRMLRPAIERTMVESDRWDGDESEEFHLGRYVEWLASEREQVRDEVLIEAADKLDRIGHAAAAFILRDDATRPAAPAVVSAEAQR